MKTKKIFFLVLGLIFITVAISYATSTPAPKISASPTSVNFGPVALGATSAPQVVTLKNTGTSDLHIGSISITGTDSADFKQTNSCVTIAPGASCPVNVTFKPALPYGKKTALLVIASNDLKKNPLNVKLSGQLPPPKIAAIPSSLNFGQVPAGEVSSEKSVTIENKGLSDLIISSINIVGADPGDFTATNHCTTVHNGGACTIDVVFEPLVPPHVQRSAILDIVSNDPKKPTLGLKLSGFRGWGKATFQDANLVIGQADFNGGAINQGGAAAANTLYHPYGKPVVYHKILYVPDSNNHRVLGFNTVPQSNDASADFVLGQPDFTTTTFGTAANKMFGPQTVKVSSGKLLVAEVANHRILIWNTAPTSSGVSADVVVGQAGFGVSAHACTRTGLYHPLSIETVKGKLIVADSDNNRVLIWNTIPTANDAPADIVLGQNSFTTCAYNDDDQNGTHDAHPTARTLNYPTDVWSDGKRLIVVDANNNRVLIWNTFPTANFTPADVVLGQGDFTHYAYNDDNQDGTHDAHPSARTLADPYFLDSNGKQLFVSDAANNRVLIWNTIPAANFTPADVVLGQGDFLHNTSNDDNQDGAHDAHPSARTLASPMGVYVLGKQLFITDESNSRYLIFE